MHFAQRRREGYVEALAAAASRADPALILGAEMMEPFGHRAAQEMLRRPDPPTAFLVSSIIIALGTLWAVRELGLEPGRDVSIVTHDDDLSFLPNGGPSCSSPRRAPRSAPPAGAPPRC